MSGKHKPEKLKGNKSSKEDEIEDNAEEVLNSYEWRTKLDNVITDEANRVTKIVGNKITWIFQRLQEDNDRLRHQIAYLQGRIEEKVEEVGAAKKAVMR